MTKNLKHYLQLLDYTDLMINKLYYSQSEFLNSLDCEKDLVPMLFSVWRSMQKKASEYSLGKYKALLKQKGIDKNNQAFLTSELSKLNQISDLIANNNQNLSTNNIY